MTHTGLEPVLAENGRSSYAIVTSAQAPEATRHAASELQHFLCEIAGAHLHVVTEIPPDPQPVICVGESECLRRLAPEFGREGLGSDGYHLRTVGTHLVIAGGEPRGTLYGVYGFLHDHLGCRWFTRDESRIPQRDRLAVPPLNETRVPPLTYRNFILGGVMSPDWCARNHVNGFCSEAEQRHGGKTSHWQFGHSFDALVPPDRYFDSHREYFALVQGQRLREESQLCCTDRAVIRLVTDNLRRQIEQDLAQETADTPSPEVYYLAQNDWGHCCECPSCRALTDQQGSHAAPVIHLCNEVVEQLDREFPGKSFVTISYRFSARPPRTMKAHPKLIVQLCPIECCLSHPYACCDGEENTNFRRYVDGWRSVASRLWVWDYTTHLRDPLLPTPGLHTLAENLRWFVRHGVSGMFVQDVGQREFNALRGYLIARLLWDPAADSSALTDEFLGFYYGAAAEPIRTYMRLVREKIDHENIHVYYSDTASPAYLDDGVLAEAMRLWDDAEAAVAGEPELHRRVQAERIHTKLARVERGSRTAILRRCRIVHGRHVVEKSDDLKAESRELLEWARAQGMDRLGLVPLSQFEHLIGSEIVDFDNGFLRVSVAPRLNARIVNLEWISEGRSLFASRDSRDSDWGRSGGYLERWLGAPPPDPMESTFGGWSTEGKMVGLYAYYAQPMYVWWAAGIEKTEPILRVSSRIINRSNGERDAAIECHWPFTLGKLDDVFVRLLKTGEEFDVQTAREHSAEQAGDGILLGNPRIGLGIRLIGSAECLASVTVRPVPAAGAVHVCLRTRSEIIIPAADARFQQSVEVLRLT